MRDTGQRVLGLAGWSGAGKTQLATALVTRLHAKGHKVSTLKHAHHAFDVDTPGKDSYRHRQAGARQTLVSSAKRWALMTELRGGAELSLDAALAQFDPCDLILVEGFKDADFPKLEVHRPSLGKPLHYGQRPGICAIACDAPLAHSVAVPLLDLNDLEALVAWVLKFMQGPVIWSS